MVHIKTIKELSDFFADYWIQVIEGLHKKREAPFKGESVLTKKANNLRTQQIVKKVFTSTEKEKIRNQAYEYISMMWGKKHSINLYTAYGNLMGGLKVIFSGIPVSQQEAPFEECIYLTFPKMVVIKYLGGGKREDLASVEISD